jgi:hypothetical protein
MKLTLRSFFEGIPILKTQARFLVHIVVIHRHDQIILLFLGAADMAIWPGWMVHHLLQYWDNKGQNGRHLHGQNGYSRVLRGIATDHMGMGQTCEPNIYTYISYIHVYIYIIIYILYKYIIRYIDHLTVIMMYYPYYPKTITRYHKDPVSWPRHDLVLRI